MKCKLCFQKFNFVVPCKMLVCLHCWVRLGEPKTAEEAINTLLTKFPNWLDAIIRRNATS